MKDPGLVLVGLFGALGLLCLLLFPPLALYPLGLAVLVFAAWLFRKIYGP